MIRIGVEVQSNLPRIPGALERATEAGLVALGEAVLAEVRDGPTSFYLAYPEGDYDRTGNLGRSWMLDQVSETEVEVGNDPAIAEYAPEVEFGTAFTAPRPSLGPSAEAVRPHAGDIVGAYVAPSLANLVVRGLRGAR